MTENQMAATAKIFSPNKSEHETLRSFWHLDQQVMVQHLLALYFEPHKVGDMESRSFLPKYIMMTPYFQGHNKTTKLTMYKPTLRYNRIILAALASSISLFCSSICIFLCSKNSLKYL